ncbi:MAG: hypothetical protein JWO46_1438 [Nocardioidaceae bacterium]|nr:hypothetical protein [Nocardioidaceae bacterium]
MEILLTGGTGYIGAAVLARLLANGHEVSAVVRSDESAAAVKAAGAVPLQGDLSDTDWVRKQLETVQAAIHTAAAGDETDEAMNDAVIDAVQEAFGGTEKPFIHTGGIWTYGSAGDITEESAPQPAAITAWRVGGEKRLLESDVAAAVIQPAIVYGQGGGIPNLLVGGPKDASGALTLIGTGDQHWTTVHVDDLADLYLRVLDEGSTGAVIGASGDNPTVRELGEATGPVVPGSDDEAAERLGAPFAEALLLDQQATGAKARALGWSPTRPTLVEQLKAGYADAG